MELGRRLCASKSRSVSMTIDRIGIEPRHDYSTDGRGWVRFEPWNLSDGVRIVRQQSCSWRIDSSDDLAAFANELDQMNAK